jgi:predicted DCC family thiol-disulfide oxidoreductase YuxK
MRQAREAERHHPERLRLLLLYDGTCGLCHGLVRFLIRRDRRDVLRFAALQSELARTLVARAGGDPDVLDTLYTIADADAVARDPEGAPLVARVRGRAAVEAIAAVGGPWRMLSALRILPRFLLDLGYRLVARSRYRLFGKRACELPSPEARAKFLGDTHHQPTPS